MYISYVPLRGISTKHYAMVLFSCKDFQMKNPLISVDKQIYVRVIRMVGNCFDCFLGYLFYDHSFGMVIKTSYSYNTISIFFLYKILLLMSLRLKQDPFVFQIDEEPFAAFANGNAFGIIAQIDEIIFERHELFSGQRKNTIVACDFRAVLYFPWGSPHS